MGAGQETLKKLRNEDHWERWTPPGVLLGLEGPTPMLTVLRRRPFTVSDVRPTRGIASGVIQRGQAIRGLNI